MRDNTVKRKTRNVWNLKFYKIMAVLVLLYDCEDRTMMKKWLEHWRLKQIFKSDQCRRADRVRNEDVRKELNILTISEKIPYTEKHGKCNLQKMNNTRVPLLTYNYRPHAKRDTRRLAARRRETWGLNRRVLLSLERGMTIWYENVHS